MHNQNVAPISTLGPFAGLGDALHRLREASGLSQSDLAGKAGLTQSQVAAYEGGKQIPSLDSLGKLMQTLGCDLKELAGALESVQG